MMNDDLEDRPNERDALDVLGLSVLVLAITLLCGGFFWALGW